MSYSVLADIVFADPRVLCHYTGLFIKIVGLACYLVPAVESPAAVTQVILLFLEREPSCFHGSGLLGEIVVMALYLSPSFCSGTGLGEKILFAVDCYELGFHLLFLHGLDNAAARQFVMLDVVKKSEDLLLAEAHFVFAL